MRPAGLRFRRQHPLGPYILDFYCPATRLAVEIDGFSHAMGDRGARDERRDAWLKTQGVQVLRIPAILVMQAPDEVAEMLLRMAATPPQSPSATAPP